MRYAILQTCAPHYRLAMFQLIADQLGSDFGVVAGDCFFDASLRTSADGKAWYHPCLNRFLGGRRFLHQTGLTPLAGAQAMVVEGNPRIFSTWKLLWLARKRGIPVAVWGHALGRGASKIALSRRLMFSMGSAILCYCYEEVEILKNIYPNKSIFVVGNSVLRRDECIPLDTPIADRSDVLLLGRLIPEKKGMLLVEALHELSKRNLGIGAVIIGDGPDHERMQQYANEVGLKKVRFAGFQSDLDEIRRLSSNAFCMVSAGYAGLSILHAQSMGLPFIYSSSEPNAPEIEIARENWNCLTFKADNQFDLADRIEQMHQERGKWLSRGEEYTQVLQAKYSIENMAAQFCGFFKHNHRTVVDD